MNLRKALFIIVTVLLSGKSFSSDSIHKKISVFSYVDIVIGNNINQGSVGLKYFDVNNRPTYGLNIHLFSLKCISFTLGGKYITKSYFGDNTNEHRLNNFGRGSPFASTSSNRGRINFQINYVSFDIKSRITLFRKKKLQPFIFFGVRYNILKSYKYLTDNSYDEIDDYIIPNIKKRYLNYTYGTGVCYNFNKNRSGISLEIELNNDNQLKKDDQKYFTYWKYGKARNLPKSDERVYGGKFQSLLINVGYRHYF